MHELRICIVFGLAWVVKRIFRYLDVQMASLFGALRSSVGSRLLIAGTAGAAAVSTLQSGWIRVRIILSQSILGSQEPEFLAKLFGIALDSLKLELGSTLPLECL